VVTYRRPRFVSIVGLDQMGAPEGPHCSAPALSYLFSWVRHCVVFQTTEPSPTRSAVRLPRNVQGVLRISGARFLPRRGWMTRHIQCCSRAGQRAAS